MYRPTSRAASAGFTGRRAAALLLAVVAMFATTSCRDDSPTGVEPPAADVPHVSLATHAVSSTADNGLGSLRQAILNAASGDVIDLRGVSGTITLTSGALAIGKNLTITGPGADKLTIARDGSASPFGVFRITAGTVNISGIAVTGGLSDVGAGVGVASATLTLSDCAIVGNADNSGFAIGVGVSSYQSNVTINRCTISGNTGGAGTGVGANGSTVTIANSTISGNTACSECPAGGIFVMTNVGKTSTVTLVNSTVANNGGAATENNGVPIGHGIHLAGGGTKELHLKNTIVANNDAGDVSRFPDGALTIITADHTLVESGGIQSGNGNITGVDPSLGPLANNGGPTKTHALNAGSAAIDAGSASICAAAPVSDRDQRNYVRPAGASCDIGAYEASAVADNTPPTVNPGGPYSGIEGQEVVLSLGGADAEGDALTYSWHLGDGTIGSGSTPPTSHTYANNGTYTLTLTVRDGVADAVSATTTVSIANAAPTATFDYPASVVEGSAIALSLKEVKDASSADVAAGFTFAFDCGGGAGYAAFGKAATASCPTTAAGSRTVRGSVKDKDGGVTEYSGTVTVEEKPNVAPIASVGGSYTGGEGSPVALALGGSDADGNTLTYTWNLGDGTTGAGATPPTSHTYADNGTYTITLTADDGQGGTDTKTATATIGNVAPKASFDYPSSLTIGGTIQLSLTGPSDASLADVSAGFTYAFDCGGGAGYSAFSATSTVSCAAVVPGIRSIKGSIKDKDGGVTEYTGSVQVLYQFTGFYAPVDNPDVAVNVAKAGSAIPVKFSLGGDQGLPIFTANYPKSMGIACDIDETPDVVEQTVNATNSGLSYDAATGQYTYTWKTDKGWAGSCRRLTVRLADGTDHVADFKFVR